MNTDHPTWLPFDRYLELLTADAGRLLDVAARDLSASVPSCPDWDMTDLCRHVAQVYAHKTTSMRSGARPGDWPPAELTTGDPLTLLKRETGTLLATLHERDPHEVTWTWSPPEQNVGFWYRRMALETAVHRVDGEQAVGEVTAVDEALAGDGVDEFLVSMLGGPFWTDSDYEATNCTARVLTDSQSWFIDCSSQSVAVRRGDVDSDAQVSFAGGSEEMLLALWGRQSLAHLLSEGDSQAGEKFIARVKMCGD